MSDEVAPDDLRAWGISHNGRLSGRVPLEQAVETSRPRSAGRNRAVSIQCAAPAAFLSHGVAGGGAATRGF
jgi:hypothetical protein